MLLADIFDNSQLDGRQSESTSKRGRDSSSSKNSNPDLYILDQYVFLHRVRCPLFSKEYNEIVSQVHPDYSSSKSTADRLS